VTQAGQQLAMRHSHASRKPFLIGPLRQMLRRKRMSAFRETTEVTGASSKVKTTRIGSQNATIGDAWRVVLLSHSLPPRSLLG
jgi:hypothetical protein